MLLGRIVSSNQKSTPCHGQSELNGIVVSEHKFFVELTQAWSYQMKAVLLAANTRRTQSCSGSGIYLQGEVRCECPKLSILTLAKIKDPIWDHRIYKKTHYNPKMEIQILSFSNSCILYTQFSFSHSVLQFARKNMMSLSGLWEISWIGRPKHMPMIYGPMPQMMSFWWPRPVFRGGLVGISKVPN